MKLFERRSPPEDWVPTGGLGGTLAAQPLNVSTGAEHTPYPCWERQHPQQLAEFLPGEAEEGPMDLLGRAALSCSGTGSTGVQTHAVLGALVRGGMGDGRSRLCCW